MSIINKFPKLKDINIPENGLIEIGRERYCSIINTNIFDIEVSDFTNNLIKENKKLIQNMLNKNAEKIDEMDEKRLFDHIYTYSFIKEGYRNDEACLSAIKSILLYNEVSEPYKKKFASRFKYYLEEKLNNLDKNNSSYKGQYIEIKWSLLFIEAYEEDLNSF